MYMNSFWLIEDYSFANDFLRFFDMSFLKNVKSHVFLKSEKNVKYVFSNTVELVRKTKINIKINQTNNSFWLCNKIPYRQFKKVSGRNCRERRRSFMSIALKLSVGC